MHRLDLPMDVVVDQVIVDGDVLEARSCAVGSQRLPSAAIAAFGTQSPRLGVFTVTPIKGERLPVLGLLRVGRASLSVQLFPYDDIVATPPAVSPDFKWGAPIHFRHTDASRARLLLYVQVHEAPLLGAKGSVGAYCRLARVLNPTALVYY